MSRRIKKQKVMYILKEQQQLAQQLGALLEIPYFHRHGNTRGATDRYVVIPQEDQRCLRNHQTAPRERGRSSAAHNVFSRPPFTVAMGPAGSQELRTCQPLHKRERPAGSPPQLDPRSQVNDDHSSHPLTIHNSQQQRELQRAEA